MRFTHYWCDLNKPETLDCSTYADGEPEGKNREFCHEDQNGMIAGLYCGECGECYAQKIVIDDKGNEVAIEETEPPVESNVVVVSNDMVIETPASANCLGDYVTWEGTYQGMNLPCSNFTSLQWVFYCDKFFDFDERNANDVCPVTQNIKSIILFLFTEYFVIQVYNSGIDLF